MVNGGPAGPLCKYRRQSLGAQHAGPGNGIFFRIHAWRVTPPPAGGSLGDMSTPITTIRNLGPAIEASLHRAGIMSAEELRELGPDAAYARLLATGSRPHFIGYYVLVMGLQGRPWNDCKGAEKTALRARFDAIKARAFDPHRSAFEAALDEIGVIERRLPS